jgi:hypothetical protein
MRSFAAILALPFLCLLRLFAAIPVLRFQVGKTSNRG